MKNNRNKLLTAVTLFAASATFLAAFAFSVRKSKGIAGTLAALAAAASAAGGVFAMLDAAEEKKYDKMLRRCCSKYDDWFHSFEYPECREPNLTVNDTAFPQVETEEDE